MGIAVLDAALGRPGMAAALDVFSIVLGAVVGSFLNACIHRLPRGLGLDEPRRSFCPQCGTTIRWFHNLPVLSYLALRGRCASCGARISPRYLVVEVLTAGLFLAAWRSFGAPLAPAYWVLIALLIAASFIDLEHFIIPDSISVGGTVAGVAACFALPGLMGVDSRWMALGLSLLGAALGFGFLWGVVEMGKLAFGRKRHRFDPPVDFRWIRDGDTARLDMGGDVMGWDEIFSRESDVLELECEDSTWPGGGGGAVLRFHFDRVSSGGNGSPLDDLDEISGVLRSVVIPREAMGFGDVKFIALIGAFLGWQAVLFTLLASSVIGCLAALAGFFLARDRSGSRVPFGPFLALGGLLWLFWGEALLGWYLGLLSPMSR